MPRVRRGCVEGPNDYADRVDRVHSHWFFVELFCAALIPLCCARGEASAASAALSLSRGTLAVAVLESNQIVLAIDSRLTISGPGKTNQVRDGTQKLVRLSPNVGFFVTGVNRFEARRWTNSLNDTAKVLATLAVAAGRAIDLRQLATEFKTEVTAELARCTPLDMYHLLVSSMKYGGSNVFSAVFVGKDADSSLRMFRVTCRVLMDTNAIPLQGTFEYDLVEHRLSGRRSFEFFGVTQVFDRAKAAPQSRVARAIRQIRSSQTILAEPIAAALLDVGVSEIGDGPGSPVGYPLFVYVADADGLRLTRQINKGAGVPFDYRKQPKE